MKRYYFLTILCTINFSNAFSQIESDQVKKTKTFIKVWGFLKYYHPLVGSGDLDWDKEFVTRVVEVNKLESGKDINKYYLDWINSLGNVENCSDCKNDIPDSLKFNLDLVWLDDTTLFSNEFIGKLNFIKLNRNPKGNAYVQYNMFIKNTKYSGEKIYKDSIYPSLPMRLLSLARYWNIIEYFYPYKYVIGQNWNEVLSEMIPIFQYTIDTISYHMAMRVLITMINDSHAGLTTKYTNKYFGYKWAPFTFKIIEGKAIVKDFYNDSLCLLNDIEKGDVFLEVNNESIPNIIKRKSRFIGASNEPTKLRNFNYAIFNGSTDSVSVKFDRNGVIHQKMLFRYFFSDFEYYKKKLPKIDPYKILDGNIGYVNMGVLKQKELRRMMNKLSTTKAIIFDVRNYPKGTMYKISKYLNKEKKPFAKFTEPDLSYPGVIRNTPPYYCGGANKSYYKGKVILLFDESTQSHAEFTLMALQTAPNVISIGSQTAGADGNVSKIFLPGNIQTYMTGLGVYYPDGRETQRIGIIPDIEVKPTIEGIRAGRDEVLDKAIEVINK